MSLVSLAVEQGVLATSGVTLTRGIGLLVGFRGGM